MGIFRFYQDGHQVAKVENTLTTHGKRELLRILTGTSPKISTLLVGSSQTAATSSDLTLKLPVRAEAVVFSTPIYATGDGKVIYKARLDESVGMVIHEMAASNDPTAKATQLVSVTADISRAMYGAGTVFTQNVGASLDVKCSPVAVKLGNTGSGVYYYTYNVPVNVAGALPTDEIVVSGFLDLAGTATLTVKITDSNGKSLTKTGVSITSTAHSTASFTISSMTPDSGFDITSTVSMDIRRTDATAALCNIDGIALVSETVGGKIISRAATSTGIEKRLGSKMDIEYEIPIDFT